ncbi:MAG: leucine-rich repeat domain-containing protein [Bacteroides sp.]|nr:leucine-rich repeat domain-containing protein [Roseburia sp.]MCM1347008.1 leucine-rich repeat domain-containing protein [Bacteroides sp.]MCM1421562.1 leucine-rich repeat domain-containing protein [Bacteroides sp.]
MLLAGCSATKTPASVTAIGEKAFLNCSDLEQLVIPEGVVSIENSAFSLQEIETATFANCVNLKTINIPDGMLVRHIYKKTAEKP